MITADTNLERRITVRAPVGTSNLAAGLDAVGLAVDMHAQLTVEVLRQDDMRVPRVKLAGGGPAQSRSADTGDLVYKVFNAFWQSDRELLHRIRITVESEVPLGAGLGGVSASLVAALWASAALQDLVPTHKELLTQAEKIAGGGLEFLAASLLGQMVICARDPGEAAPVIQQIAWPEAWTLILAVPGYRLKTADARAVLPELVPLSDAIFNVQRVALLVAAVCRQDEVGLKHGLEDRLHEGYRAEVVPELMELKAELVDMPILGCVLSGAGPSVLVVVHRNERERVQGRLKRWAKQHPRHPEIIPLDVAAHGVEVVEDLVFGKG